MDQNFQTSFIPKKPMIEERAVSTRPIGFLMIVAIFILFTTVISTAGLYFYDKVLKGNITQMQSDLVVAKNRFEPARINELQTLDRRLSSANEILAKHIAISPIFQILEDVTMKTVRYTKFSYTVDEASGSKIDVKMNGVAVGYRSIALQSDLFTANSKVIDPVFSNLTLDDKGNVAFELDFQVDSSLVNYKHILESDTSTPTTPVNTTTN